METREKLLNLLQKQSGEQWIRKRCPESPKQYTRECPVDPDAGDCKKIAGRVPQPLKNSVF